MRRHMKSESVSDLNINQISEIFDHVVSTESFFLNHFIQTWKIASDREKAYLFQSALQIIWALELEPHIAPNVPASNQTYGDAAVIMRGYFEDMVMNPEEKQATRKCIRAAEILDTFSTMVTE